MVFKVTALFLAVAIAAQVSCQEIIEVRLEDRTINYLTNPLISTSISIPHLMLDTLEACIVDFPNGLSYEVFPNSNLPDNTSHSTSVFPSCLVFFRNPPTSMSGIYELTALTSHHDGRRTLQRQRYNLIIREIEP